MLGFGIKELDFSKVYVIIASDNIKSIQLMLKLGFKDSEEPRNQQSGEFIFFYEAVIEQ